VLNEIPHQVEIMHIFYFNSKLKRMAVVVKSLDEEDLRFYMKGAPEMVAEKCMPDSLPHNFDETLGNYTREGYRVLGMATKLLPGVQIS